MECGQIKRMASGGELGEIISVHGGYVQDWLLLETDFNWRINSKESGQTRAVADIGSHWIDTVEYVTQLKVTEVFAEFLTYHKKRKKFLKPVETFSKAREDAEDNASTLWPRHIGEVGPGELELRCCAAHSGQVARGRDRGTLECCIRHVQCLARRADLDRLHP